jgi:hypothetical protein
MPPQKTQIACPRCRQPVVAQIEQLFDVSADPGSKQRLLGSVSNYAVCKNCGYNGPLATPIVYHDNDKELLLTYFPSELGMAVNDQEKMIGPLINQVTSRLQAEKRKGYLLRPQNFLTYQSLIERILGADGITPEMIQAQQKRIALIERLLTTPTPEARSILIKAETALLDAEFFSIFSRLVENATASGQEQAIQQMNAIQSQLLAETEYGRKVAGQANEIQEAMKTLQAAGKSLDREKLLDILIEAPTDDRLNALVSMTRPGLDYQFFQSLTGRIETKSGDDRKKMEELREKLLEITKRLDQRAEEEFKRAGALLNTLLSSTDIPKATAEHLDEIGEIFIQVINQALQDADKKKDSARLEKLQQIVSVLQQASAPPPELALIEELLSAKDEPALNKMFEEHAAEITPEFSSMVASVLNRSQEQSGGKANAEETDMLTRLEKIYRAALKFSMMKNLK